MSDEIHHDKLQQQSGEAARHAPGQQNQQTRHTPEGPQVTGERHDPSDAGLEGGVDTGVIKPGDTDQV